MAALLGDSVGAVGEPSSEAGEPNDWLILRLTVRAMAMVGLSVALLVAVLHAFVALCRRTLTE